MTKRRSPQRSALKPLARTILHIDMDAFFAAVEVLDNPHLKGKPVIVGGTTNRGVVSTASYEARRYGVHSAMPIYEAKQRCPEGVFLPVRMRRYAEFSQKVLDILRGFSPLVEQVSIDEAYLDITGTEGLFGAPEKVARRIKKRICNETRLTCSIGIAPTKFLAKVASDMNKPEGLTIILGSAVSRFLTGLPVEKIPGVGEKSLEKLYYYGIKTVGDLRKFSQERLLRNFGKFGQRLYELAEGEDNSPVVVSREPKSISSEGTFESDTVDLHVLSQRIKHHADSVGQRLRRKRLRGCTIVLKIKYRIFPLLAEVILLRRQRIAQKLFQMLPHNYFLRSPLEGR